MTKTDKNRVAVVACSSYDPPDVETAVMKPARSTQSILKSLLPDD